MLGELNFLAAKISQVNVGDLVRFGAHARDSSIDVSCDRRAATNPTLRDPGTRPHAAGAFFDKKMLD
jgi:hypothetical protein